MSCGLNGCRGGMRTDVEQGLSDLFGASSSPLSRGCFLVSRMQVWEALAWLRVNEALYENMAVSLSV